MFLGDMEKDEWLGLGYSNGKYCNKGKHWHKMGE